ncbi:hypothetical protein VKT23_018893 [Stygiomarasmius scandens]|uniref:Argonaute 1 n=1 Tax=Marasmiellus scandens TaxID=2682957 RepID=A0ABR1IMS3_9AGAR
MSSSQHSGNPGARGGRGRGRGRGRGHGQGGEGSSRTGSVTSSSPSTYSAAPTQERGRGRGRGRGGGDFENRRRGGGGGSGQRGYGGSDSSVPLLFGSLNPPIDARLRGNDQDKLIGDLKQLEVRERRPFRPGYGTVGNSTVVRANFFAIRQTKPGSPIYEYKVEIHPNVDKKEVKSRIFDLLEQSPLCKPLLEYIAHDKSERLVSAKRLPDPLDIKVKYFEEGEKERSESKIYTVSIIFSGELDMNQMTEYTNGKLHDYNHLPLSSALDLVLQQHAARNGVRVGKNRFFFPTSSESFNIGKGIIAFRGYDMSVRPVFKQLMVNVNACMTAFVEPGNLADIIMKFATRSGWAVPAQLVDNIKVTTTHLGYKRRYKLKAVATTSARKTLFYYDKEKRRISVEDYFNKEYGIKLEHPDDLPVVDVAPKNIKKSTYIPAELCEVEPGQPYRGVLTGPETRNMVRNACNKPAFNATKITEEGFAKLGLKPPTSPVNGFGISVSDEMAVVPARELPPPSLNYFGPSGIKRPSNGAWNIVDGKFHRGAQISKWWVLVVRDGRDLVKTKDDRGLVTLLEKFRDKMRSKGMTVPDQLPDPVVTDVLPWEPRQDPRRQAAVKGLRKIMTEEVQRKGKPNFILVILSNEDKFIYPAIKRIGDVDLGVHTIHMQFGKAGDNRGQDQYLSNIALKVNTKLGGINHKLDASAMTWLTKETTMMVGIDVTHRGPGSRDGAPSIAAVVASEDNDFVQFPASLRIQQKTKVEEMLDELQEMMVERLEHYKKKNNGRLPMRIFVFRDGVSEGQYDQVIDKELPQIQRACSNSKFDTAPGQKYQPRISIVVCGKRHHARFFPTDSQHADRNGNTVPGTIVDRGVTSVLDFDFYLQAHAGIQGSVKATHYIVVYDETRFSADELQQGTHNASYLYARATRSVSLIPPAYYADLAAERGRYYLNDFLVGNESQDHSDAQSGGKGKGSAKKGGSSKEEKEARQKKVFEDAKAAWGQGVHPDIRGSMFYI